MTRDDLFDLVARRKNARIIVRANGQQAVQDALQAGCDGIEQGYHMGPGNLQTMAQKKVLWIPSLLRAKNSLDSSRHNGSIACRFSFQYTAPGKVKPGAAKHWKATLLGQLEQLRQAKKMGIETAVGTGAGSEGLLHGESVVEELKLFVKAGHGVEEALQCAIQTSSAFFKMKAIGPLTKGQKATFLVTRGTAKQLPRKLSYLEAIYINGSLWSLYSKDPHRA
jgi:imidazolonepropionase-like amidohydrolase